MSSGRAQELKPLTSLRFVAALMVFFEHFPPTRIVAVRYGLGGAGVGFFFVLSGFILTYTYHRDFDGQFSLKAAWRFHRARIARVYPVHFVTMTLCLAWFIPFGSPEWNITDQTGRIAATLAQALLLQSWIPNPGFYEGLNAVSWSISVEAFFYALFPFLLWLALKLLSKAHSMAALIAGTLWTLQFIAVLQLANSRNEVWALYRFPPLRLLDFVVGILVAIAFIYRSPAIPVSSNMGEFLAIGAVAASILATPHIAAPLQCATALMPFWAALIFAFGRQSGVVSKLLAKAWCVRLGEVSFAFYMLHYVVLVAQARLFGWSSPALAFCIGIAVTLSFSFAMYHYVETPMRRLIRGTTTPPILVASPTHRLIR